MNRFAPWRRALGIAVAGISMITASAALAATTVNVWCWDTNFNGAAMREAAARYNRDHPDVTINIDVSMSQDDIRQKLQTQLLANNTQGLPDIVLIQDDVAQKYLQSFPGAFVPLGDSIDMSQFAQYKVAAATHDGKAYSLPFDSGVTGLFYRTDYLDQAGYKAADLQDIDWDKLIDIGKTVKAKTGHNLFGLDLNGDGLIRIMMQSAGAWYFNKDGSLNIVDNAPLKAALTAYGKIWQADIVKPVSGWTDFTGAFTSGDTVGTVDGAWMVGTIKSKPDQSGKWGVAPTPKLAGVDGATHYSNEGGSSWYVLSSGPGKDAAIDFLKTIWAGDKDFYQKILVGQGAVGTWLAARDGEAYKSSDEFFGGQPVWANFSDWLAKIPGVDYGTFTAEVDAAVVAQLPAIAKGGSVDDALKAINDQAQQQMQ
ncbi:MAG: ABC transporter substrate-binding protein [Devosia sp. 67-54]|uniref:ABC transporter substrate-binding protein n=1 Tax=unclassified Devosia TaxID=196773 RepID=UPI0009648368|nr:MULTISPECIES: extracellular solute-binding protein [unclassified Devosia]MBN9306547.1 extracellular solute-binding protein [Devosia sp.]OJX15835.1 MAG: ABC transporter substrate-binding protein [Devosia sp. 67-54]